MEKVLMLGAGSNHTRRVKVKGKSDWTGQVLVTTDIEPTHNPDVVWDLNVTPWPFGNSEFEEVHAYEVLEHLGRQGDLHTFFGTFAEIYRILKPDGSLAFTVPRWDSPWAWGDPGHTRVIGLECMTFLDQTAYDQVGHTPMADYRSLWRGDFKLVWHEMLPHNLIGILRAVKPPRRLT